MSVSYQYDDQTQPTGDPHVSEPPPAIPQPLYTILMIAGIGAVFIAQLAAGIEESALSAGFLKPAFLRNHEYWRILTGATTHGGLMHVLMNCYAFYSFGRIIEVISNRAHLAIVFLFSAIAGGVLSLVFVPDGLSVGASGGVVGLIGYLAVYAFKRRKFVSYEFRKSLLINIGFILIFGLALYQVIDNYGHIGGLIFGTVYGLLQVPSDEYTDPRVVSPFTAITGFACLGVYLAACAFSILLILRIV